MQEYSVGDGGLFGKHGAYDDVVRGIGDCNSSGSSGSGYGYGDGGGYNGKSGWSDDLDTESFAGLMNA